MSSAAVPAPSGEEDALFSHKPVKCPLADCHSIVGASTIFNHFLIDHHGQTYEFFKISENQLATLLINTHAFPLGENTCLGIFAFSGPTLDGPFPADKGICLENSLLPPKWEQYKSHLAVLVMGCRLSTYVNRLDSTVPTVPTSTTASTSTNTNTVTNTNTNTNTSTEAKDESSSRASLEPAKDILVFWFISGQTSQAVYATITVRNKEDTVARTKVVRIRTLNEAQEPLGFLSECSEYMFLSRAELDFMDDVKNGFAFLDIKFHHLKPAPNQIACFSPAEMPPIEM